MKKLSFVLLIGLIATVVFGCSQTATTNSLPSVSSNIVSSAITSTDMSSIEPNSSSSITSEPSSKVSSQSEISKASSKAIVKSINPTASADTTTSYSSTLDRTREIAIAEEDKRHQTSLAKINQDYQTNLNLYTQKVKEDKSKIPWYNFDGGTFEQQRNNSKDDEYIAKLNQNEALIRQYENDVNELYNIKWRYPYAIQQEDYEYDKNMKRLKILN